MHLDYKSYLKKYSQINRKISTKSEGLFWNTILKGDRTGYRFLRQKPIEGYILDFYCPKLKLCIEIDGESHEGKGEYDEQRDQIVQLLGIKIIRYHEKDVLKKLEAVSIHINAEIEERVKELKL
ncbi:MAG: endonuclease domain-containing protein [Candidatus Absconditabacterales bacterium]